MIYLIPAAVLGLCLGIFSAYRQKTFIALVLGSVPLGFVLLQLGGPAVIAVAFNEHGGIGMFTAMFKMLPQEVQSAIIVFPAFVILGRLGAWLRINLGKPRVESNQDRKKRILKQYGYNDGTFH